MIDGPPTALVTRAANGDQRAWDALVERYAPLTWSICRRYQLGEADADDVGQTVWLQLLDHLGELREPAALAGWLATTTHRECARAWRAARKPQAAGHELAAESIPDAQTPTAEQELLAAERDAALREAFTRLPRCCQQLIALLIGDQPLSYAQISAQLGIPAGSIGPRRGRCLGKMRRDPAIAALLNAAAAPMETEPHRQAAIRQRGLVISCSPIPCTAARPGCTRISGSCSGSGWTRDRDRPDWPPGAALLTTGTMSRRAGYNRHDVPPCRLSFADRAARNVGRETAEADGAH